MRRHIAGYWPLYVAAVSVLWFALAVATTRWAPQVPRCPEDATIMGGGDYRAGYWDYLYCGPAVDDLP